MRKTDDAELKIADFLEFVLRSASLDLTFTIDYSEDPKRHLVIHFRGDDSAMLIAQEGQLLDALKYLILEICELPADEVELNFLSTHTGREERLDQFA